MRLASSSCLGNPCYVPSLCPVWDLLSGLLHVAYCWAQASRHQLSDYATTSALSQTFDRALHGIRLVLLQRPRGLDDSEYKRTVYKEGVRADGSRRTTDDANSLQAVQFASVGVPTSVENHREDVKFLALLPR